MSISKSFHGLSRSLPLTTIFFASDGTLSRTKCLIVPDLNPDLDPQYYFYCAYREKNGTLEPDQWMNDVGEKIPNWFESARLYYAYTGDTSVMTIVKNMADYTLEHGISPANFSWPNFPYTTTNAGDTEFRGFTSAKRFSLHEIQVDHAGEMGLTYYRLYQYVSSLGIFCMVSIRPFNGLLYKFPIIGI